MIGLVFFAGFLYEEGNDKVRDKIKEVNVMANVEHNKLYCSSIFLYQMQHYRNIPSTIITQHHTIHIT
jgi:hypothetical protein